MKSQEINCKVCGKSFSSISGLHLHLSKTENLSQEDYYCFYYPRFDLYTGKALKFKNYNNYFIRKFADKINEFNFFKKSCKEVSCVILSEQLDGFFEKSKRFPSYCEWRSSKNLRYDLMQEYDLFDKFCSHAKEKGFLLKKKYEKPPTEIFFNESANILTDTREQMPLFEGKKTSINVGDYTFDSENYNSIHVDRKSKEDFVSTFTAGLDRFSRECQKAKDLDIKLVVLVESSFSDCFSYTPLKFTKQKVDGSNAFYGLRKISREFDIDFLFVENRKSAADYIVKILSNPNIVENYDLQYLYEKGWF